MCNLPSTDAPPLEHDSVTSAALTAQPAVQNDRQADKQGRHKLWDLPHKLHCPVIGTCLGVDELRTLARKARCHSDRPMTDYDVHVSFVSMAAEKNALSLAAQKALAKKYAAQVRRFAKAKTTEQLADLWNEALSRGDVPGGFWAIVTHRKCDNALRTRAFEDVHMLSHQIGAGQRADLQRLAQTEAALAELRRDLDTQQRRSRRQLEDREQRISKLESALRERNEERHRLIASEQAVRRQLAQLQARATDEYVSNLEQQSRGLERRILLAEREREHWQQACEAAQRKAAALAADLQCKVNECKAVEQLIALSPSSCHGCDSDSCADCPDLRGRRILCVGGRNQLIDHYRALVARCNGRFDHHDGGIEDNRQRLEGMLSAADAVLCATDSVSHDAYYRLKRFCKRYGKPHVFLSSSGLSTFARALETVAE
jgi:hypothetical protein